MITSISSWWVYAEMIYIQHVRAHIDNLTSNDVNLQDSSLLTLVGDGARGPYQAMVLRVHAASGHRLRFQPPRRLKVAV
ncbi:hypothetical protein WAI453_000146 [Rhynchosporium graminicola]